MAKKRPSPREFARMLVGPYRDLFPFLRPHLGRFILALIFGAIFGRDFRTFAARIELREFPGFSAGQEQGRHAGRRCERHRGRDQLSASGLFGDTPHFCSAQPVRLLEQLLHVVGGVAGSGGHSLQALHHILGQSLEFFNRERSGNLISRVANDTRMAQTALTSISSDLIKQPLTVISAFAVLIHLDWKFTIVSLFLFPVCMVPIVYYGKKVRRQGKLEEEKVGSMMSILQESFAGIRVIKAFAREKREAENFEALSR